MYICIYVYHMGEHSLAHAHYGSPLPCVVTSLKRLKASSSSRGPAHGIGTLANEASDIMGRGLGRQFLYLHFLLFQAVASHLYQRNVPCSWLGTECVCVKWEMKVWMMSPTVGYSVCSIGQDWQDEKKACMCACVGRGFACSFACNVLSTR